MRGRAGCRAALTLLAALAMLGGGCANRARLSKAAAARDLGYAYLQEGNPAAAIEQLREAVELNPRDPDAHHKLGLAYFARGLHDAAEAEFRRATTLDPEFPEAWLNWGSLKLAQSKWEEAIPLLTRAAEDPTYREPGRAWHNLGWAYYKLGQRDKARECYRRVLKATPLFCPSIHNLGLVEEADGALDEATRLYRRARECNPRDLSYALSLGAVLARQDLWAEAVPLLRQVAEAAPEDEVGRQAREILAKAP